MVPRAFCGTRAPQLFVGALVRAKAPQNIKVRCFARNASALALPPSCQMSLRVHDVAHSLPLRRCIAGFAAPKRLPPSDQYRALLRALEARHEDSETLQRVTAETSEDEEGMTLFHHAARMGHQAACSAILEAHKGNTAIDIRRILNTKCQSGRTPLHHAAEGGSAEVCLVFLKAGADPAAGNALQQTPLHLAAFMGHTEALAVLLAHRGVQVNSRDISGETPLHRAAQSGHLGACSKILQHPKVRPNVKEKQCGWCPLHVAVLGDHLEVCKLFLTRRDVDPNAMDTLWRRTALHHAADGDRADICRELLARQDLKGSLRDVDDATALDLAVEKGRSEVACALLASPLVDPNSKDRRGWTALHAAVCYGEGKIVKAFLERPDTDVNAKLPSGNTASYLAREYGHTAILNAIKLTIKGQASPESLALLNVKEPLKEEEPPNLRMLRMEDARLEKGEQRRMLLDQSQKLFKQDQ